MLAVTVGLFSFFYLDVVQAAVSLSVMRGRVTDESIDGPVVGALVTLYDGRSNLMIDYTFTDDKGRFHLSGDTAIDQMFIVVSSPKKAKRFDNITWTGPALLVLSNTKKPLLWRMWISGKLNHIVNLLLGIAIGLAPKWFADRKARRVAVLGIRRELNLIIESKNRIMEAVPKGNVTTETVDKEIKRISRCRAELGRRLRPEEFFLSHNKVRNNALWDKLNALSEKLDEIISLETVDLVNDFHFNYQEKYSNFFKELERIKNDL